MSSREVVSSRDVAALLGVTYEEAVARLPDVWSVCDPEFAPGTGTNGAEDWIEVCDEFGLFRGKDEAEDDNNNNNHKNTGRGSLGDELLMPRRVACRLLISKLRDGSIPEDLRFDARVWLDENGGTLSPPSSSTSCSSSFSSSSSPNLDVVHAWFALKLLGERFPVRFSSLCRLLGWSKLRDARRRLKERVARVGSRGSCGLQGFTTTKKGRDKEHWLSWETALCMIAISKKNNEGVRSRALALMRRLEANDRRDLARDELEAARALALWGREDEAVAVLAVLGGGL